MKPFKFQANITIHDYLYIDRKATLWTTLQLYIRGIVVIKV